MTEVDQIGPYQVDKQIGVGGLATVFKAHHAQTGRPHAIKMLNRPTATHTRRVLREAKVQALLSHPNLIRVTDVLQWEECPCLVMEFVDGETVAARLERGPIRLDEALQIFRAVVLGIRAAHEGGMVHRDLKPANVLVPHGDPHRARVIDFGFVKLPRSDSTWSTRTGATLGTPAYMAPEQYLDAAQVDTRADLRSLGCLLYELTTGRSAFPHRARVEIWEQVAAAEYPPPQGQDGALPDHVVDVIDALLQPEPDDRIQDCSTLLRRLYGTDEEPNPAPVAEPSAQALEAIQRAEERFRVVARRRQVLGFTLGVLVSGLLGVLVGLAWQVASR